LLQERILEQLPQLHPSNPELSRYYRLLRSYPQRAGKLIRGRLLLLSTAAHGAVMENGAVMESGLDWAAALELFQSWVLIHDDVEDDSLIRRGEPALHRQVGVPVAINTGDGLHVYMWQLLIRAGAPARVLHEFLETIHRTAEGQHLDLSWVTSGRFDISEEEYLEMVRLKTGRYTVVAPLRLGAFAAGSDAAAEFLPLGLDLGAAFQIRDDVLNLLVADPARGGYGKEFAGDLHEAKRTLILAHFLATASRAVHDEAIERLRKPRSGRTAGDEAWLLAALNGTGSLIYAQERAEQLAAPALAQLAALLAELPGKAAASDLLLLLRSLANRQR
jgi:geranylgeranyl diphosphate synthase type II